VRIIDVGLVTVLQIAYARASRAGSAEHVLLDFRGCPCRSSAGRSGRLQRMIALNRQIKARV
jgi:hypothetical protein